MLELLNVKKNMLNIKKNVNFTIAYKGSNY